LRWISHHAGEIGAWWEEQRRWNNCVDDTQDGFDVKLNTITTEVQEKMELLKDEVNAMLKGMIWKMVKILGTVLGIGVAVGSAFGSWLAAQ